MDSSSVLNVSVVGLGYVGSVFAACLSQIDGVNVCGVDSVEEKVSCINMGCAPMFENSLSDLISTQLKRGKLSATTSLQEGIQGSKFIFVCVGTPNRLDGHLDTSQIFSLVARIADLKACSNEEIIIAIRSTVTPGTCQNLQDLVDQILLDKDSKCTITVIYCPEFLREGSAINDYHDPSYIIVGVPKHFPHRLQSLLNKLFSNVNAQIIYSSISTSESIKSVSNSWHALKVAFANEVSSICKTSGIDQYELMDIFVKDTKLNISSVYLTPGPPYGGSCLTKDLAGLTALAASKGVHVPLLSSIDVSNQHMLQSAVKALKELCNGRPILLMGLSFKVGTDDLRSSPALFILESLLSCSQVVHWHDSQISSSLKNKLHALPLNRLLTKSHVNAMVTDVSEYIKSQSPLCVITKFGDTESLTLCKSLDASYVFLADL